MKKQFIKFSAVALTAAAMAFNSSCSGEEEEKHTLSVAPQVSSIVFAANGESATSGGAPVNTTFEVTTNRRSWDVTVSSNPWLTYEKSGNTFTLNAAANFTTTARDEPVTVTVTADNATPVTISVTQLAADYIFLVSPDHRDIVFSANGQSATSGGAAFSPVFTVTLTEGTWNVEYDEESWLTVTKSATGFTLSAAANAYADVPEPVEVRVTDGKATITLNVTQLGNPAGTPKSAVSTQKWTVPGGSQVWSDYIEYDGKGKVADGTIEEFTGGTAGDGDYRGNHPNHRGYYYSWYYVEDNQDAMCPSPWRVPSKQDIINMDKAMGGTGVNQLGVGQTQVEKYVDELGFIFSGRYRVGTTWSNVGTIGFILSNETADEAAGNHPNKASYFALFSTEGTQHWSVMPQEEYDSSMTKDGGVPVRCVRDGE